MGSSRSVCAALWLSFVTVAVTDVRSVDARYTGRRFAHSQVATLCSPGVPVGEGCGTLDPEVGGSIPLGAICGEPTWCSPAIIRPCHGRDLGSNPGVGVVAWSIHAEDAHRGRHSRRSIWRAGPGRVCNLHGPMRHSRPLRRSKYAPTRRETVSNSRSVPVACADA